MLLANNEYTFHFKGKGETTQEQYHGDFVVKCVLSNAEQVEAAIRTDRYNGGSKTLADGFKVFNRIIAELELRIKKAPTWWTESRGGWDLHDANIVHEVFAEVMKSQDVWTERLKEKATEAEKSAEANPKK
jgi:hypothetical protein